MKKALLLLFKNTVRNLLKELLTLAVTKAEEDLAASGRLTSDEKAQIKTGMILLERAVNAEIEHKLS